MKRFAPFFVLLAASFAVAPLAAATSEPLTFNTIVVHHFTNANGMTQSQDFIQYFSDYLCQWLVKDKVAAQVVEQGTAVPDAVAANSLVIEGKFLSHENASIIKPGKLIVEISIYRLSDYALAKTWTPATHFPINGDHKDRVYAYYTGVAAANMISDALKSLDLSSIPPAAPGSSPAAPGAAPAPSSNAAPATPDARSAPAPSSNATPAGPDAVASVQLSSYPDGAEITIDGSYVGNTPSLIKLGPGTHSIRMTMPGYAPWVRSIETAAGESRNLAATLEKTSP
ncbi:MAG: PEGA domain-containing protein [Terracidiphilus sp.]